QGDWICRIRKAIDRNRVLRMVITAYSLCSTWNGAFLYCRVSQNYPRAASRLKPATQEWGPSVLIGPAHKSVALAAPLNLQTKPITACQNHAQPAIRPIRDSTNTNTYPAIYP